MTRWWNPTIQPKRPALTPAVVAGESRFEWLHGGRLQGIYSPIVGDPSIGYTARPITMGMKVANRFAGATFIASNFRANGGNAVAYAARRRDPERWMPYELVVIDELGYVVAPVALSCGLYQCDSRGWDTPTAVWACAAIR